MKKNKDGSITIGAESASLLVAGVRYMLEAEWDRRCQQTAPSNVTVEQGMRRVDCFTYDIIQNIDKTLKDQR